MTALPTKHAAMTTICLQLNEAFGGASVASEIKLLYEVGFIIMW
jgi:hypothetical protein